MRINDQGFTERLSGSASRVEETNGRSAATGSAKQSAGSDQFQLSRLASQLQGLGANSPDRSARLNEIAKAVNSNSYPVDAARISQAMVSEAVQYNGR